MATRDERALESVNKEIDKIKLWFDKNNIQLNKWVIEVQDSGFLKEFNSYKSKWLSSRYSYTWNLSKNDVDTKNFERYLWEELNIVRALSDKDPSNKKLEKILNKIDSIINKISDMNIKYSSLNINNNKKEKLENIIKQTNASKTPEQIKYEKKEREYNDLKNYIKNELPNINIPTLEKWLQEYKELYINWVNNLEASGAIKSWEASQQRMQADRFVEMQKLDILTKAWSKVGRVTKLSFAHIGSDGSFNGFIDGEKGRVQIETILAGGYNIQRLHYRVLVKEFQNKDYSNEYNKLKNKLYSNILESNKSYIKDIPILNNLDSMIIKIGGKDFLNKYNIIHFDNINFKKDYKIVVFTGFASLTKNEKIKFTQKIKDIYEIKDRKFGLIVLNSGKNSMVMYNPSLSGKVEKLNS